MDASVRTDLHRDLALAAAQDEVERLGQAGRIEADAAGRGFGLCPLDPVMVGRHPPFAARPARNLIAFGPTVSATGRASTIAESRAAFARAANRSASAWRLPPCSGIASTTAAVASPRMTITTMSSTRVNPCSLEAPRVRPA
jgi:hypothetical protein